MNTRRLFKTLSAAVAVAFLTLQSCAPAAEAPVREIRTLNSDSTAPLIENLEDSPACHVKVDFKLLKPASAEDTVATVINRTLQRVAFGKEQIAETPEETIGKTIANLAGEYRNDLKTAFEAAQKEGDDLESSAYMYTYDYEITSELNLVRKNIYNYEVTTYAYTGGAHPNTTLSWINLDAITGKELTKADFFKNGCEEPLAELIGKHLVTLISERLESDEFQTLQDLYDNNILFEEPLKVPENFLITDEGVKFLYNRYEIAAYAMGDLQVLIPYEELKEWMK